MLLSAENKPTIHDLRTAFASGAVTPTAWCEHLLARIETHQKDNVIFVFQDVHKTLEMAHSATQRWRDGTPLSIMDGIPVTIKDNLHVKGWPTVKGSKALLPGHPEAEDNCVVAQFRQGGAVFLGKTALCEFGHKGVTDSAHYGITRNPHNPHKTSGGSSGGAAVAAYHGLGSVHLGNDGGGSVRIPASFCGVWGLKTSYGRFDHAQENGLVKLTTIGPLTRTYDDLAQAYAFMANETRTTPQRPLRIAYAKTFNDFDVQPDTATAVDEAVMRFKAAGHTVTEIDFRIPDLLDTIMTLWTVEMMDTVDSIGRDKIPLMDPSVQKWLGWGETIGLSDFTQALKRKHAITQEMNIMLHGYDALVMPTMPLTAFDAGQNNPPADEAMNLGRWWTPFTAPFNLSGWPALSCPVGMDSRGLPVGVQVAARTGDEALIFSLASVLA